MLRRGTAYGPELPEGVLDDDGQDRGLMFAFIGAHLGRQFEFVQSEWLNGGDFLGIGDAKDPIAGSDAGAGAFSIPNRGPRSFNPTGQPTSGSTRRTSISSVPPRISA